MQPNIPKRVHSSLYCSICIFQNHFTLSRLTYCFVMLHQLQKTRGKDNQRLKVGLYFSVGRSNITTRDWTKLYVVNTSQCYSSKHAMTPRWSLQADYDSNIFWRFKSNVETSCLCMVGDLHFRHKMLYVSKNLCKSVDQKYYYR